MAEIIPCICFEDDHLLVVNKPAGVNTHAPAPFANEGIYDWLKHREPRWARLAIIHRLDKETSGLLVFGKTELANKALLRQFTERTVAKRYVFASAGRVSEREFVVRSWLVRVGDRYVSRGRHAGAEMAETRFRRMDEAAAGVSTPKGQVWEAEPLTGRTHQIRVQAADRGIPILGDSLYGGERAARVWLHASELRLRHPASGREIIFGAPADFQEDRAASVRRALIDPTQTNAYRLLHGASDGWAEWYVDRLGDYVLSQSKQQPGEEELNEVRSAAQAFSSRGIYHKVLKRSACGQSAMEGAPRLEWGEPAPAAFNVQENGLRFEISFNEGYSIGLFLDQRDNRRRLLTGHVAADFPLTPPHGGKTMEVLNTFAYTCGFSVCAAKAGARVTSVDLSRKYLEWGRRNFELNDLDTGGHDFIYGDTFSWLRRLAKKGRRFDVVLLDPPTFSQSRESGVFRVEKDYAKLVSSALPLLKPGGVLFASSNAAGWPADAFLSAVKQAVNRAGRKIEQLHYVPQPLDFPISRAEPGYLKTVWLRAG
jgi:23S rRNA (cytosine1962-C5)-methyltransferase